MGQIIHRSNVPDTPHSHTTAHGITVHHCIARKYLWVVKSPERNYYIAQLLGWAVYIIIATVVLLLGGQEITTDILIGIYLVFALGLVVTHAYRWVLIRLGWPGKHLKHLLPRVILATVILSVLFHATYAWLAGTFLGYPYDFSWTDTNLFTWLMLFFIWNAIYFAYVFFKRYRGEELKNLRLEAARNEFELRRLRDQMNPHFIFNAMNTIRALIDENPHKAKDAVTRLSNVLRNSLKAGRTDLIALKNEIEIVKDYLAIEQLRYEERLHVIFEIQDEVLDKQIPPLMLQTLVENAMKHGISKLPHGGDVRIYCEKQSDKVMIRVVNTGTYNPDRNNGFSLGLENTRDRLRLSFGESALLRVENGAENEVSATIIIPVNNIIKNP